MAQGNLLKRVSKLGFPLFETEETQDVNVTLADMVKSKDLRLWEGFPVVLANSAEKGLFDYGMVKSHLKESSDQSCLDSLMSMSLALYKALRLKFSWADRFYKPFPADRKKDLSSFLKRLKKDEELKVARHVMDSRRLKSTFNNYLGLAQSRLNDLLSVREEFGLEYALSQVFSPKQKELFFKKLKREKLTKTEKEYFSRVVKKKVLALANPGLHRLSKQIAGLD